MFIFDENGKVPRELVYRLKNVVKIGRKSWEWLLNKMKGLEWDGYQNDKEECEKSRAPLKEKILGTKGYGKKDSI